MAFWIYRSGGIEKVVLYIICNFLNNEEKREYLRNNGFCYLRFGFFVLIQLNIIPEHFKCTGMKS